MDMQQKVKEILNSPQGVGIVYFIGIGGIGMSALARYFKSLNKEVSGYDKTETTLTKELVSEGIKVHYNDDLNLIPKDADLVIYTPAVPQDHEELNYFRDNNYAVVKRSDVLGAITADRFNICIGGTHGKTTVSAMTAHILRHTGYGCNAFLGGISTNYETNFWSSENETCVVEADEYDRSFLKLSPDIAVITSIDADHLDIYGTEENLQDAFVEFGLHPEHHILKYYLLMPAVFLYSLPAPLSLEQLCQVLHYPLWIMLPLFQQGVVHLQSGGLRPQMEMEQTKPVFEPHIILQ